MAISKSLLAAHQAPRPSEPQRPDHQGVTFLEPFLQGRRTPLAAGAPEPAVDFAELDRRYEEIDLRFEAALSNDLLVAERGAQLGLPEVLFNMFPGMGAYSFLCRRLDGAHAKEMILSGRLYSAEELHEMGVIDLLLPAGGGEAALREHLERKAHQHGVHTALARVARRCQPVSYDELIDVTEIWVETALGLTEADLRRMERLASAQERRRARVASAAVTA